MMASPHWKTPNNHDNATFSYGRSSNSSSSFFSSPSSTRVGGSRGTSPPRSTFNAQGGNLNDLSSSPGTSGGFREAGIVEKLLPSYGFIQCCERQARLFFHYSQFQGNIEHLKLGDPVEFEMTYDRRTGKPIASTVVRISSEAMMHEELSCERVTGFITTELTGEKEGRVAYENRGECFFLPFTKEDLEDVTLELRARDSVTFQIATDKSGNLRARKIQLANPLPQRYQGVVCTLKESFGFIERADVVREIFFHSSECKDFKSLALGDDVEFSIQTRNDKEVAVNVKQLEPGTVVFEDVSPEQYTGQIVKTCEKSSNYSSRQVNSTNEPFPGKIIYKCNGGDTEIAFGERDLKGEFTMHSGDLVRFNIVTDRRDKLKHATNIELHEDAFKLSNEHREQGYIASLRDSYGFIKCLNREGTRIYFRIAEILDSNTPIKLNDEVEFTACPDVSTMGRLQAIRIKFIPNGTIMKNLLAPKRSAGYGGINGANALNDGHSTEVAPLIDLNSEPVSKPIENMRSQATVGPARTDSWSEILSQMQIPITHVSNGNGTNGISEDLLSSPNDNDELYTSHAAETGTPRNRRDENNRSNGRNGSKQTFRGFVAALKETFGFIENEDHKTEVFFHYSIYDGNIQNLDLGAEVEYTAVMKNGKFSAESVKKLSNGSIMREEIREGVLNGFIARSVRCLNPEQEEYPGLIEEVSDSGDGGGEQYEFGMTGLYDIHDYVQKGDVVTFQVGLCKRTGQKRAVNIQPVRNKHQATVDAVKGNFGFLNYDVDEGKNEGKKLFFHMSEVKGDVQLHPGDLVEFYIVHNQRSGKSSACCVVKINDGTMSQRPERLITKIKSLIVNDSPRIVILRQPRAPDGSSGFAPRTAVAVQ